MKLKFIKEKNGFRSYQAASFKVYYGKKDSIAGDNKINSKEKIYLLSGKMHVTIDKVTKLYTAPVELNIPAKTYHKLEALTEIIFLIF